MTRTIHTTVCVVSCVCVCVCEHIHLVPLEKFQLTRALFDWTNFYLLIWSSSNNYLEMCWISSTNLDIFYSIAFEMPQQMQNQDICQDVVLCCSIFGNKIGSTVGTYMAYAQLRLGLRASAAVRPPTGQRKRAAWGRTGVRLVPGVRFAPSHRPTIATGSAKFVSILCKLDDFCMNSAILRRNLYKNLKTCMNYAPNNLKTN